MPRGGSRPGSGRKPKDATTARLHSSRRRTVVPFPGPVGDAPVVSAEPVAMPDDVPADAAAVWAREAPFALAAGTLTVGTAQAFALFCRSVVLERQLSVGQMAGSASHRGMIAVVTAGRLRFGISPNGKPLAQPKTEVDPFAKFDRVTG